VRKYRSNKRVINSFLISGVEDNIDLSDHPMGLGASKDVPLNKGI
jgi:hypothetical protein